MSVNEPPNSRFVNVVSTRLATTVTNGALERPLRNLEP